MLNNTHDYVEENEKKINVTYLRNRTFLPYFILCQLMYTISSDRCFLPHSIYSDKTGVLGFYILI